MADWWFSPPRGPCTRAEQQQAGVGIRDCSRGQKLLLLSELCPASSAQSDRLSISSCLLVTT